MDRVVFVLKARPGTEKSYADYLRKNRLSDETLGEAGVNAWSIFMQGDQVVAYLEAEDMKRTMSVLSEHPEAKKFEEGEAEFLLLEGPLNPLQEIFRYERG